MFSSDSFVDNEEDGEQADHSFESFESHSDVLDSSSSVSQIEDLVMSFMNQLSMQSRQKIESQNRKVSSGIRLHLVDRKKANIEGVAKMRTLQYPKKSGNGSLRPFAQLFRVLDQVHEATRSGIPVTKRDIFYKDVSLFKTQKTVDILVDDIAATFKLERSDLNIRSSPKGLICGSGISINLVSGNTIRCSDSEATLIPAGEDIHTFSVIESVAWVLVVEKEAVFQTLCQLGLTRIDELPGPGLLITGRGYPDVATRHLVKSLADALPRSIPILGLVDGDPYGLDILSVYKFGSKGMSHEKDKLAARRLKWLGIWASELANLGVPIDKLLPITKHDEKKALAMLRKTTAVPARWKKELQYMLHSRRKAEIEVLSLLSAFEGGIKHSEPHTEFLHYISSKLDFYVQAAKDRDQ